MSASLARFDGTMAQRHRPRYEEIASYLRQLAADAAPDARMPSDAELCERFGVSRMTARQAVQQIVNEGLVYRKRGHGTFRAHRRIHRVLGSPLSFTENMRRRGFAASSRLLTLETAHPTPDDAAALDIDPSETVTILERLRFADGVPMAIERVVLSPRVTIAGDFSAADTSLHEVFEMAGHEPTRAYATVSARMATKRDRELMDLPSTGVVMVETRVISDQHGLPLEHTETRYAAARYEFDAVLYRGEAEDAR
jgi:GntR family transcriptional regulator